MRKIEGFTTTRSIILEILNHVVRKENESGKVSVIKSETIVVCACKFFNSEIPKIN